MTDTDALAALREDAIDKALLYVFQLSGKDYREMRAAGSAVALIRALGQDGFTVAALAAAPLAPLGDDPIGRDDDFLKDWPEGAPAAPLDVERQELIDAVLELDKVATWSALNRPEYPRLRAAIDAYRVANG